MNSLINKNKKSYKDKIINAIISQDHLLSRNSIIVAYYIKMEEMEHLKKKLDMKSIILFQSKKGVPMKLKNGQALCVSCHRVKTKYERQKHTN